jgi:hypothetical protein
MPPAAAADEAAQEAMEPAARDRREPFGIAEPQHPNKRLTALFFA